jgi:ribosomal protein L11 methyltransferase
MPANYFEARLTLNPDFNEILMAELGQIGYESFVETDEGTFGVYYRNRF